MSLIHPALLFGLAFIAIPVVLHFMLRSKPKRFIFPAMRFIQERKTQNIQRMRLRHFWLLLLRISVIALLVFAVARPSLPAANYELNWLEIAVVLGIIGACIGVYFYFSRQWTQRELPDHQVKHKSAWMKTYLGIGGFVLLLLLVAWPYQRRIQAEFDAPTNIVSEKIPVAAVMIFDTSVSMEYLQEGQSRIELAKSIASDHINTLPNGSRVAIAETSKTSAIPWQADMNAAASRVKREEAIKINPLSYDLNQRIQSAIELQRQHREDVLSEISSTETAKNNQDVPDRFVREIYLFTDLTAAAWRKSGADSLRSRIEAAPWLNIYLIDVGVKTPINYAISDIRLSSQTVTRGRPLYIESTFRAEGEKESQVTAELHISTESGKMIKQGEVQLNLIPGQSIPHTFTVSQFSQDITRGEIRLVNSDPVERDNKRFFTVRSKKPQRILLVSDDPADSYAFSMALAPAELVQSKRAPYEVVSIAASNLDQKDFDTFDSICLVNVSELSDVKWDALNRYVVSGGGLAVVLGNTKINPLGYQHAAETLLPAAPFVHSRFRPPEFIDFGNGTHPLIKTLDDLGAAPILSTLNINRFWKLEEEIKGTVVARFSDSAQSPALIQRRVGSGNVLLLATSVDLRGGATGVNWSDLIRGGWTYMAMADQMMQTVTGAREQSFNATIGTELSMEVSPKEDESLYWLRLPGIRQENITIPYRGPFLTLSSRRQQEFSEGQIGITDVGHYSIVPDKDNAEVEVGFSINLESQESDFSRLPGGDLDSLLGPNRYQIATDIGELQRRVNEGRLGRDVSPLILFVMLLVFCGEHFVANFFYKNED